MGSFEGLKKRLAWGRALESKGLRIKVNRMKMMIRSKILEKLKKGVFLAMFPEMVDVCNRARDGAANTVTTRIRSTWIKFLKFSTFV